MIIFSKGRLMRKNYFYSRYLFFFIIRTAVTKNFCFQVLSTGGFHRGGNGHYLPAARGGDASFMVAAGLSRYPGANSTGNSGMPRSSAGLRWYTFHRPQPPAVDQNPADLELAAALLRELYDQQSLLQRLHYHGRGLRGTLRIFGIKKSRSLRLGK